MRVSRSTTEHVSDRKDAPKVPEAYVVLDVDYAGGAFVLVLENIGTAPAFRPRVDFSHKLIGSGGEVVISELPIWQRLGLLPPGKSIRVFLDAAALVYRRKGARRFRATVTFDDEAGNTHKRSYDHDLDAYAQMPQIEP